LVITGSHRHEEKRRHEEEMERMKEQLRKEYEEKERKLAEAAAEAGHSHWFCRSAVL
jgi:hypothetical protein